MRILEQYLDLVERFLLAKEIIIRMPQKKKKIG